VIRALTNRRPDLAVAVRSTAPARLFTLNAGVTPDAVFVTRCDTGIVQLDSLRLDEAESLRQAEEFHATLDERAATEATFLHQHQTSVVVGDIPPLAFSAAVAARVPSVAIGNFTWDWIYEWYPTHSEKLIETIRRAQKTVSVALRLPGSDGFAGMEAVLRDMPFIARKSERDPEDVKRKLNLPLDRPLVVLSFGGYGLAGLNSNALADMREYAIATTDFPSGNAIRPADGLIYVAEQALVDQGLRYPDLVRAADVVITKPGYGIITECIANDTAMLYTSRGRFREYDLLVQEMSKYIRAQFIEQEDLLEGRWTAALERLLASPRQVSTPALNGADVAADAILEFLGESPQSSA
jgi:hypothetical protein